MLVDQADKASEIVVPASGTYFQPLCAVYSKACVRLIERQLSRGDPKVDHLFAQARVKSIAYEQLQSVDPQLNSFFNVNTPLDMAAAAAMVDDPVTG